MKKIVFIAFICSFFQAFASDEVRPERDPFEVMKDTFDAKIPKGKCLIEGTIYDNYSGEKLGNVSVLSGTKNIISDKMGYFRVTQALSVKHLKFSKAGYTACYLEDYAFKDQHRIVVRIYIKNAREPIHYEVKKPVIYCYSDKDLDFEFNLKPKGNLFFSYPPVFEHEHMANNTSKKSYEWNMSLKKNMLTDLRTSSTYPYLFWESVQYDVNFKMTAQIPAKRGFDGELNYDGEIIARNDMVYYLDSVLSSLGLNAREKTDFITFWAPQMKEKNLYLIQFLQDEECDQFATYEIEPLPSKVNRLYMLFSGFDQLNPAMKTKKQVLKPIERKGFYMVDWGGVEVPLLDWSDEEFPTKELDVNNTIIKN